MTTKAARIFAFFGPLLLLAACSTGHLNSHQDKDHAPVHAIKLHWFIPDGLRADPNVFKIYEWAQQGKLPNLRKMMEMGSYGYSIPVFPSHTPVNYASLFTGTSPLRNGVADGPIHEWGHPLASASTSGFSSTAKTIDPVWTILENAGMISTLMTVPGSTPPEMSTGNVVKGRWGGWGTEFPAVIFQSAGDDSLRLQMGRNNRVFGVGGKLTDFIHAQEPAGWTLTAPKSFSTPREVNLRNWGHDLFVLITDSTDDGVENYDTITVSRDKKTPLFSLHSGQWSDWFPVELVTEANPPMKFQTSAKIRVIRLGDKDSFRIRVVYGGLNGTLTKPEDLAADLNRATGPMVDFVDNFPPQLIYFPEDKAAFTEESDMSFAWHQKAAKYLLENKQQDVFIHSIYSPNQMLTGRWWMGVLDPRSRHYHEVSEQDRAKRWDEVLQMYKHVDDMLGDALATMGPESYLVLSSDHGAAPLNQEVRLNNVFAKKGWLKYHTGADGIARIDWAKTKVVFLIMNHIYINPRGLGGNYHPAHGPAYEKLRSEVLQTLKDLADSNGEHPLSAAIRREQAESWGLPEKRVGDLVVANALGFSFSEDLSADGVVFADSLKAGYKQAILPEHEPALWTPFVIVGPGVKKGHALSRPISHLEQLPTLLKLLKVNPPYKPDRGPITEILSE